MATNPEHTLRVPGDLEVDDLLNLARDKSVQGRTRLAEVVGDLFLGESNVLSDTERVLMTDILRQLIHDVEMSVRKKLADRLADSPDAPSELVQTLANDDIEVAHSILSRTPVLQDLELIEIIQHRTYEHQLSIAMRDEVSESVSDALVETGDVKVIRTLIEKPRAEISDNTMEFLVNESKTKLPLQEPLLDRPDLNPGLAKKMYWWVSAALRQYIVDKYEVDESELDAAVEGSVRNILGGDPAPSEAEIIDPAAMPHRKRLAEKQAAPSDRISAGDLLQSLRNGDVHGFLALFGRASGLRPNLIKRLVYEPGGEGLAVACKSIGMKKSDFGSLFLLSRAARPGDQTVDPNEVPNALGFFDRLTEDAAKKVTNRWRLDPDYLHALKQIDG